MSASNYIELYRRQQKVIAICDVIDRAAVEMGRCIYRDAAELADFWDTLATPNNWVAVEKVAGVRESSKQTRLDVVARLRARVIVELDASVRTHPCTDCGLPITNTEPCPRCADYHQEMISRIDPHSAAEAE